MEDTPGTQGGDMDGRTMPEVVEIGKGRKKRGRPKGAAKARDEDTQAAEPRAPEGEGDSAKKSPKRKSRMKIILWIVEAMKGGPGASGADIPFPEHFIALEDREKVRRPAVVREGDVVVPVAESVVISAVLRFAYQIMDKNPELKTHEAKEIYTIWLATAAPVSDRDILDIAQLSEPGLTWHRLPFDIEGSGKPTPTFDEMMSRTSNAKSLMAWIGGLLVDGSERQQYLYLYGAGENGKGRLNEFLRRIMGRSYRAERLDGDPNQFWTSGLIGARLVAFPDFDCPAIFDRGWFKALTGADPVRIEPKNQAPYTADLIAKFFFIGNSRPSICDNPANRRRIVFCEIEPLPPGVAHIPTRKYEDRLWEEGAEWLAKCMALWHAMAGETGMIVPEDHEPLRRIMDCAEESFLVMAEKWLDFGKEKTSTPAEMQAVMQREGLKSGRSQGQWYKFLESRFWVRSVKLRPAGSRDDGPRERVYRGCAVRESMRGALDAGF